MSENKTPEIVLLDSSDSQFERLLHTELTFGVYKKRGYQSVWMARDRPSVLADSLVQVIRSLDHYGLQPRKYHLREIQGLMADSIPPRVNLQRADVLLTDAFIAIAQHLRYGRLDRDSVTSLKADSLSLAVLATALKSGRIRASLEKAQPEHRRYHQLRDSLQKFVSLADTSVLGRLDAFPYEDSSALLSKIIRLGINLDRWRLEPLLDNPWQLYVNIPSYHLQVLRGDSVLFESRTIVGTPHTPTPVLNGMIKSFTLFPYWNVPRGIAVNEILPKLKRDSVYLQTHRYEVLDVEGNIVEPDSVVWKKFGRNNFPFTIRQREGMSNSLGMIKFSFNNPYSVYLHDTNARRLFRREKRCLSHGCVRVERAMDLARFLLSGDDITSPEDLDQYAEFGKQMTIRIPTSIPVRIRYFTCDIRNGRLEFYDDIYGHDKAILESLNRVATTSLASAD